MDEGQDYKTLPDTPGLPDAPEELEVPDRRTLIRDVIVFQFKLLIDGFRDLALVPISLLVAVVSFLRSGRYPGTEFYDLLRYGRETDRAINLFGAADRLHHAGDAAGDAAEELPDLDQLVDKVEEFVTDEYSRGDITAQAKQRLDRVLAAMQRHAAQKHGEPHASAQDRNG